MGSPLDYILGGLPIVGGIIESAIDRNRALKDRQHLEDYYHPKNQVARLKEAGLSPGLLYGSKAAGQSAQPQATEMNTGLAEGAMAYQATRINRMQMDMLKQQVREQTYKADILEKERDYWTAGQNRAQDLEATVEGKKLQNSISELERQNRNIKNDMARIDYAVQNALYGDGTLVGKERQTLVNLTLQGKQVIQETINMVTRNEQMKQDIVNMVTTNQKLKGEIALIATTNQKRQQEIKNLLANEEYVRELIEKVKVEKGFIATKAEHAAKTVASKEIISDFGPDIEIMEAVRWMLLKYATGNLN